MSQRKADIAEVPDSSDLDALREMERSPGFVLYSARIATEIERLRTELEGNRNAEQTWTARGQIKGLRTAQAIPGFLKHEISEEVKHGKTDDGRT